MLSFVDAYTLWRRHPFPKTGTGSTLPETHGDLAVLDEYVTAVIRFVERGIYQPVVPDVLERLRNVMRRIELAVDAEPPTMKAVAREQHAYAALMYIVYQQFLAMKPASADPKGGAQSG
jgi:hypothetical protein